MALFAVIAVIGLCSCGSGSAGQPSEAAATRSNSSTDFDGSFLAGTAKDNGASPETGDFATAAQRDSPVARRWVQIGADTTDPVQGPLSNAAGRTIYHLEQDTPYAGTSSCDERCAKEWPPVTILPEGTIFLSGVLEGDVGHLTRDDGLVQLTIKGRPLYLYSGDTAAGDAEGHGSSGLWFATNPAGGRASIPQGVDQ